MMVSHCVIDMSSQVSRPARRSPKISSAIVWFGEWVEKKERGSTGREAEGFVLSGVEEGVRGFLWIGYRCCYGDVEVLIPGIDT